MGLFVAENSRRKVKEKSVKQCRNELKPTRALATQRMVVSLAISYLSRMSCLELVLV